MNYIARYKYYSKEADMPIISIEMHKAETQTKEALIKELTDSASKITQIPKESFTVLINELEDVNIGLGGKTLRQVLKDRSSHT